MRFRFLFLLPFIFQTPIAANAFPALLESDQSIPAQQLRVSNQHPFSIREPVNFSLPSELAETQNVLAISQSVSGGTVEAHYLPIQLGKTSENRTEAMIDVQLRPGESRLYTFQSIGKPAADPTPPAISATHPNNLPAKLTTKDDPSIELFDFLFAEFSNEKPLPENRIPIEFKLTSENHGPVKSSFTYTGTFKNSPDSEIEILYDIFPSGIVDFKISLNLNPADFTKKSLAIAKILPTQNRSDLDFQQHDKFLSPEKNSETASKSISWITWHESEDLNRALLIRPASIQLLSPIQIDEQISEFEKSPISLTSISNLEKTASPPDSPVEIHYRLLPPKKRTLEEIDQIFTSFSGFKGRFFENDEFHFSFGSQGASFGFNYSPRSIFGKNWENNSAQIERDFRIAKALGLEWIKIENHKTDPIESDFSLLAEIAEKTGLKLYLKSRKDLENLSSNPKQIGFLEISPDLSTETIAEIRKKHPEILLASKIPAENPAEIDALSHRIDLGSIDSFENIGSAGNIFAGKSTSFGKLPILEVDNQNLPVRKSDEKQATLFYHQLDSLLKNGSASLLHQGDLVSSEFFQDTDSENFPLLYPDRTPKVQALALHTLIDKYGNSSNPAKMLDIKMETRTIRPGSKFKTTIRIRNLTSERLEVELTPRLPKGLTTESGPETTLLAPRQAQSYERTIRVAEDLEPGFFHYFEEARLKENIHFGWTWFAHRSPPKMDLETSPDPEVTYLEGIEKLETINPANLRFLIHGDETTDSEILWARQLQETLQNSTGATIRTVPESELDEKSRSRSLVLTGTLKSNPLISELAGEIEELRNLDSDSGLIAVLPHPDRPTRFLLIVSGGGEEGVKNALRDLIRRFD